MNTKPGKKLLSLLLAAVMVLGMIPGTVLTAQAAETWDGSTYSTTWYDTDTTAEEFYISTAEDLAGLAKLVNDGIHFTDQTICLEADIDLGSNEWTPIGAGHLTTEGDLLNTFCGAFDGGGHTVSGLKILENHTQDDPRWGFSFLGLFGVLEGTVKNVSVEGVISGSDIYCYAGGIVAYNAGGIQNCVNYATIAGQYCTGGIAGYTDKGTITKCINEGTVTHTSSSNTYAGGIVGMANGGTISLCINRGKVSSESTKMTPYLGGILGVTESSTDVSNCLNTAEVSCKVPAHLGGVVGQMYEGEINNCLNTGTAMSTNTEKYPDGAITGELGLNAKITNSYYLDGSCTAGIGINNGNAQIASKSQDELQNPGIITLLNVGNDHAEWGFGNAGHPEEGMPTLLFTVIPDLEITNNPDNQTVKEGQTASFEIAVTGGVEPYTYLWQQSTNSGSNWKDINGTDANSYKTAAVTTSMSGYQYRCVVSDVKGTSVTSSAATLTVTENSGTTTLTVTFNSNGGSSVNSVSVESGTKLTIPKAPTKSGYLFAGWYTDSALAKKYDFNTAVTSSFTLYAKWTQTHEPYIAGYKDGTFKPNNSITRAEVAQLLYNISGATTAGVSKFNDVSSEAWYHKAVTYLNDIGVISGYPDGSFKPSSNITRAEFVTLVAKYSTLSPAIGNYFKDVDADHWAIGYITAAYKAKWIAGYEDGTFRPDLSITRAEAVSIINAMLGREIDKNSLSGLKMPFTDVSTTHWAYYQILEAAVKH